ncbi:hypothetical protein COY23_00255 [bacterium (Candidatus Torokbacteria) CG_4_10_14_0_2_um_filter_35_8]|nr:MAG: hypothetical protein COY23_00255 [bacterium (Candidatus Torokbacteria) CG_4_10_14_0_2_um_filter_35_8]
MEIFQFQEEDKDEFSNFLRNCKGENLLLQSWGWGEVAEAEGKKVIRFGIRENGEVLGVFLVIIHDLVLGKKYFYIPRGPVIKEGFYKADCNLVANTLKRIAGEKNAIFLRVDPLVRNEDKIRGRSEKELKKLEELGFKKLSGAAQPEHNWVLDISKDEDTLLSGMKPKTRYNIRLAKKREVEVYQSLKEKDLKSFWGLIQETASRDKFTSLAKEHYESIFKVFKKDNLGTLFVAKYKDKILGINMVSFFGGFASYLHGASSSKNRNLMATYLLQWEQILEAKKRGCSFYDFGGVVPDSKDKLHKWHGITRFKAGFSGERKSYVGTWDLPISRFWYSLYKIGKIFMS